MENTLKDITPEMTLVVNDLIARDFEDATKEEIELYANWSRIHALHDSEVLERREMREVEIRQRMENSKREADAAIEALNALTELAQARLKAVENGQA